MNRQLILLIGGALCAGTSVHAQDDSATPSAERWSIHFQATSIGQHHGSFPSLYEGENSLPSHPESRVSLTATVFLAFRVNSWTELVFNPEDAGGKGFGQVTGIAGFTNGEIPRVSQATPTLYPARGFIRNTWAIGSETHAVEGGPNQLAGPLPVCRFTMITGKFALTDYFDNNSYSHDPRRQFMNWSLMSNGAWDYPADTRGYTIGAMQELTMRDWSLRAASVLEPTEANGPTFDTRIAKNRGEAVEWEGRYRAMGHSGALRILGFLNRERAGTFRDSILPDGGDGSCGYPAARHKEIRLRPESRAGNREGRWDLCTLWMERRQDRGMGIHANRPFRERRAVLTGAAVETARRQHRGGGCAKLPFRRRSEFPGRRRSGIHHRRRTAELQAGVDRGSLLRLARPPGVDFHPRLPARRESSLQSRPGTCLRGEFTGALGAVAQCAQAPIPALRNPLRLRAARPARRPPRRTASAAGRRPGSAPPSGRPR